MARDVLVNPEKITEGYLKICLESITQSISVLEMTLHTLKCLDAKCLEMGDKYTSTSGIFCHIFA
jgi:hypothetical protein